MRGLHYGDVITESPTIAIVWYQEIFIHTAATEVISVGAGNGTSVTRTSIHQNEGQFAFGTTSTGASFALTQINYQSTATVAGAVLYVQTL